MTDELWILVVMAGIAALLALIALAMFAPKAPAVPPEGPIRFTVRPFRDLEPQPEHLYLGDAMARSFVQSLERYDRFEASVGDGPARFVVTGSVKKTGPRLGVRAEVSSDGRTYWRQSFDVKEEDRAVATARAVDALARKMKVALK
jgi:TolB-like protein